MNHAKHRRETWWTDSKVNDDQTNFNLSINLRWKKCKLFKLFTGKWNKWEKITVINSRQLNIVVVKKHGFPSHTNLVRRTVVLFCIFLLIFIMQRGNPTCDRANSATNIWKNVAFLWFFFCVKTEKRRDETIFNSRWYDDAKSTSETKQRVI